MEAEAQQQASLLFGVVSMMARNRRKIPSPVPSKAGSQTGPSPPFPAVIWSRIARP